MANSLNFNPDVFIRASRLDKNHFHKNNEGSLFFMLSFVGKVSEGVPRSA